MSTWENALLNSYEQLAAYLVAYVPQLLGALILLIVGWIIAWLVAKAITSLGSLFSHFINKISLTLLPDRKIEVKPQHARLAGRIAFWVVILFFFAAATSSLGMSFIAIWLKEFLSYLPSILAGGVIILGGYFIGSIASAMTIAAAESTGFRYAHRAGMLIKWVIIAIAAVIGIEQLGINIHFVTTLIIVLLGVFSLGVALAYGLGSSELVKNLVGSRQANKHLRVGDTIAIAGVDGRLIEISASMLVIETANGKALIPARFCMETQCHIIQTDTHNAKDNTPG